MLVLVVLVVLYCIRSGQYKQFGLEGEIVPAAAI